MTKIRGCNMCKCCALSFWNAITKHWIMYKSTTFQLLLLYLKVLVLIKRALSGCFGFRKHDAEVVFIATRAGLTRLLSLTDTNAVRSLTLVQPTAVVNITEVDRSWYYWTVFFDLFFEIEPFATILIALRTNGSGQEFDLGALLMPKFEAEGRQRDVQRAS